MITITTFIFLMVLFQIVFAQDIRKKGQKSQSILNQQIIETTSSNGDFWGVILDGENGEPLPSVKVEIVGKNIGILTDIDGKFQFKDLEPGVYKIKISSTGYQTKEIDQINVNKGEIRLANISLPVQNISTEEVVITSTLDKETEVASMVKQINSIRLNDVFSMDIILRTSGNLTLGNALNRAWRINY